MYLRLKHMLLTFILLALVFSLNQNVRAESDGLVLEWEQHWETYGVGGTCNFNTHNFFVGDVDSDGVTEMVTGGFMYYVENDTRINVEAPLRIWNWNGENFTCEKSHNWVGSIHAIYAGDADGDGATEIVTGGYVTNSTGSYTSLRVWSYNGEALVLKGSHERKGITFSSIFINDVDNDGAPEILTAGSAHDGLQSSAQLCIWQWDGSSLDLKKSVEWCAMNESYAYSVYAYDLDNDGETEVVTGGYDNDLMNSSGQLRVWRWNGEELTLEANEEWRMVEGVYGVTISGSPMGNTMVNNLKADDIDDDGTPEIVTGGWTYDGEKIDAQLRIWNWNGHTLTLEKSHEWTTEDITEIKAIAIADVDDDKHVDIVTSGLTSVYGSFNNTEATPNAAQLRVWSWNGETLTLKQNRDWTIGDGVVAWNVATGDADEDGTVEIVTVGCMGISGLCDPDLRIWSIAKEPTSLPYPLLAALGIVTLMLVIGFLVFKKRRKSPS
jgi:LPXTG-motif cell wall-anchored protein